MEKNREKSRGENKNNARCQARARFAICSIARATCNLQQQQKQQQLRQQPLRQQQVQLLHVCGKFAVVCGEVNGNAVAPLPAHATPPLLSHCAHKPLHTHTHRNIVGRVVSTFNSNSLITKKYFHKMKVFFLFWL